MEKERKENICEEEKDEHGNGLSIGMCLGVAVGTAIGTATDNIGLWMPLGLSVGMCLGLAMGSLGKKKDKDKEE